ncbi:MAG: hypothetical protein Q9M14_07455 [Mariprofundaceae bacterium]|nr:hypothetical protein [Mariprofundaceae bacterium]
MYHEGHGGWKRKTFNKKPWLIKVAKKVKHRSERYAVQIQRCKEKLDDGGWFW